jgi:hypothetical protein
VSQLRKKIARLQAELLTGLARGQASHEEWNNKNFKWAFEGFMLNRIVPDNYERVQEALTDCFPNHAAYAPLNHASISQYCPAIKTTGSKVDHLDHYFFAVQKAMQNAPRDAAARDALFLDWASARVQAQAPIETASLTQFIKDLSQDTLSEAEYLKEEGIVIIKCLTNLIHFLGAPHFPVKIATESPGNKPFVLIYKDSDSEENRYLRFSNVSGLKFQQTFFG